MKNKPLKPPWSGNCMPARDFAEHRGTDPLPEARSLTAGRGNAFSRAHRSEEGRRYVAADGPGRFADLYGLKEPPAPKKRSWRWGR
jgi:hypothetical protein